MPVKILHIISSLGRGGRERQLAIIVSNTDFNKYPTKIVYFNKSSNEYIDDYELSSFIVKINSKKNILRLFELYRILKEFKPDIVYTWANFESIFILLLKVFTRINFINGSIRHGIRSKKFSHHFRMLILHLSNNIVANSYAGLRANNLRRGKVLFNGIEKKFINKLSYQEKLYNRKIFLKIEDEKLLFISVANLVSYKDYYSILSVLKEIKEEGVVFHYIILGDGPLRNEIQSRINEYNLADAIKILGNVSNVQEYLQMSDIFIHSSKGEGCSNAILEAMAAGLPVIASDTGGTSEIVTAQNGTLFEYKNISELKKSISKFINNKNMIENYGEKSHQIIKEKFTIDQMMNNYYKIIESVAKQ